MFDIEGVLNSRPVVFTGTFLAISLAILYLLSIFWVYRDVFSRTKSVPMQIISIVLAILFPFLGLLMHTLIRPAMTLEERRIQLLEEKILRSEFEKTLVNRPGSERSVTSRNHSTTTENNRAESE